MGTEVVKRLINVGEYYKMAEVGILKPDDRVELINGEIYEMSPISSEHALVVDKLAKMLFKLFDEEIWVRIQNPIRLGERNEPEPDISLLKYQPEKYASALPGSDDVLAIIEVANSSLKHDKEIKAPLYARHGIPVYWIIDVDSRQVGVYQYPKGESYQELKTYTKRDDVQLLGKSILIKELLP